MTENRTVRETISQPHGEIRPGTYVCLSIEDNGKGMDAHTKEKLFEPFFSTKFQGRGLGMAAVHGIVINHEGWISVNSELKKGTNICIGLPAAEILPKPVQPYPEEPFKGRGNILLIEDEKLVAEVGEAMLENLGYNVLLAETGERAIYIVDNFEEKIDLVLLDIGLPDIQGDIVYNRIMKSRPDLKVLICSGYTLDGPAQKIIDAGAQGFISKPYAFSVLSEKVRETVSSEQ